MTSWPLAESLFFILEHEDLNHMSALFDEPCRRRDTPTCSHPASSLPAALRMSKRSSATRQLRAPSDPRRSQSISTPLHVRGRSPKPVDLDQSTHAAFANLTQSASVFRPGHRARSTTRVEALESEQAVNTCTRVRVAGYARDTPPRARVRSSPIALSGVASAIVERRPSCYPSSGA